MSLVVPTDATNANELAALSLGAIYVRVSNAGALPSAIYAYLDAPAGDPR